LKKHKMGSYCDLYISDYQIVSTKNAIDPFTLSLFQPEDLRVFKRKIRERKEILHGREPEADEVEQAVEYSNTSKNIKDRLEVMGFTMKKVEADFKLSKQEGIKRLKEYLKNKAFTASHKKMLSEMELLQKSNLDDFLKASKIIIEKKYRHDVLKGELPKTSNNIVLFLLEHGHGMEKFPFMYDIRVLIRSMVEIMPDDVNVTYDVSEIAAEDYYEDEIGLLYENTVANVTYDYEIGEKFLILTEGSTDIQVLQAALDILYPHLKGYYSFMDFGISNASGSAGSLVASVKSFVGTGIKNRVIAIFDNDTAADVALQGLKKTNIPNNIRVLKYPAIKIADKYPTIGPSGISVMNINGLAGSIELYFGKDVLTDKGKLIPVQWKGYDQSLGKYQGEILNKTEIQKKFQGKVNDCLANRKNIHKYDWSGLDAILKSIFNAFN